MADEQGWSLAPKIRKLQTSHRTASTHSYQDKKARGSVMRNGSTVIGKKHNITSVQPTNTQLCKTSGLTRDKLRTSMIITAPIHVSNVDRFAVEGENLTKTCCGRVISERRPMIVILLGRDDLLALPCRTNNGNYLEKLNALKQNDYVCLTVRGEQHKVQNDNPAIAARPAVAGIKTSYINFTGGVRIQYDDDIHIRGTTSQTHYKILSEFWFNHLQQEFASAREAVAKFEKTVTEAAISTAPKINDDPAVKDVVPAINIRLETPPPNRVGIPMRSYSQVSSRVSPPTSNLLANPYRRAASNL